MFLVAQYQIRLHGRAKGVYVTIGVLAGQCIMVFSKGVVVLVIEEALAQVAISCVATATIGEDEILRQGIGLVPRVRDGLVRAGFLFGPAEGLFGKVGKDGVGGAFQHGQGIGISSKFMSVDQAAAGLVECISGKTIVDIELPRGLHSLRE